MFKHGSNEKEYPSGKDPVGQDATPKATTCFLQVDNLNRFDNLD
jgi:hypothetical protein